MKILFHYLKQYRLAIFLVLVLASINQIFSMMDPLVLKHIIDKFVMHASDYTEAEFMKGVLGLVGLALGAAMMSRIAKNFQDYFLNRITLKLGAQIYTDGLKHSLELPYSVFEDQRSGETLGVLQKVRTDVERLISASVNILFVSLIGIVVVVALSFKMSPLIAPVYLSMIPILGFVSSTLSKKVKKIQKRIVGETTALSGSTTESLRNIELVKSLGLANQEINRLNNTTVKILGLELQKVKYIRSISFVQGTIVNLLRNSVLFLMMFLIFRNELLPGEFFMFFIYSFFIFGPLQELGNIILTYREAEASLNNFQKIIDTPIEYKPNKPATLNRVQQVHFNDVSFKHLSANTPALQNVSFDVKRGETVAFVGPSGSGKSTLIKLLVGLYNPVSGHVKYDNTDSKEINLDELRKQIGFVTQETQLFAGTIRENLLFVNPTATDEELFDVLHKAACHTLLARADKGLDTTIGEGGVKVSGGEKQRLSIARALLRKPSLLVFDEATSALDSITEEEISRTIQDVNQRLDVITIMVAHRLSTIMHADRIYVLEKGRIIEQGRHLELIEEKGLYYAMWRQQIGERNENDLVEVSVSAIGNR